MSSPKIFVGTSGWVYPHWQNKFYPKNLLQKNWLAFYAKHFITVEVNATFYHQVGYQTFMNWQKQVTKDFIFSVKVNRFITHILRLKNLGKGEDEYFKEIDKILHQPIFLFQLPPNFSFNRQILSSFLNLLPLKKKYAFEFRHLSWFNSVCFKLLSDYNCALVIADSPNFPKVEEKTADFIYIRLHGGKKLYASCYTEKELKDWAQKIKKWSEDREVFAYFNNDAEGFAIDNAKTLIKILDL